MAGLGLVGGAYSAASVDFSGYIQLLHYRYNERKLVCSLAFNVQQFHINLGKIGIT